MTHYATFATRAVAAAISAALLVPAAQAQNEEPWYRTQVPEITAERWEQQYPLPQRSTVTRADYLRYVEETYPVQRDAYLPRAGAPDLKSQYIFARREGFFYRVTGDEQHALNAMKFIRGDYAWWSTGKGAEQGVGFNVVEPAMEGYLWIKDSPSLTAEDHQLVHDWMNLLESRAQRFEFGAMNRSAGWATGRRLLALAWPDDPNTAERLDYADKVWGQWWEQRDTFENAEGYNALWWSYVVSWLQATGEEDLYQDPGVKELVYRFVRRATPLGPIPAYGDGPGWNNHPGRWIWLLEKWASVYNDGRLKWIAHRIFEYTDPQQAEMLQWGNINYTVMDELMGAYLVADDGIAEVQPDWGMVTTERAALRWFSKEERQATMLHAVLTDERIPDKLILRTGWEPASSYAMVELCPPLGHGQGDAGAINSYISQGSLLLSDTPYIVRDHELHNSFIVKQEPWPEERVRWRAEEFVGMKIALEDFHHSGGMAYARVHITDYMKQPVTVDRRIFFLGDDGIWVRDTVEATQPWRARIGPAWQTVSVYGERGDDWVNTCHVTIPVAFIWELKYMMQWTNRPWDLLVKFAGAPNAEMVVDDVTHDDSLYIVNNPLMNNFKWRIWNQEVADLAPGEPRSFDSLLVPHAPTPDASELAQFTDLVMHSGGSAVVRVPSAGGERLAGINDAGETIEAGQVTTDARWFAVRIDETGLTDWWVVDATKLTVNGRQVFSSEQRQSADSREQ